MKNVRDARVSHVQTTHTHTHTHLHTYIIYIYIHIHIYTGEKRKSRMVRRLEKAQRAAAKAEECIFDEDAMVSYCMKLVQDADQDVLFWQRVYTLATH